MRAHDYVMPPHPGLLIAKTRAALFFHPIFSRVTVSNCNFGISDGAICFLKSIQQWKQWCWGQEWGSCPFQLHACTENQSAVERLNVPPCGSGGLRV